MTFLDKDILDATRIKGLEESLMGMVGDPRCWNLELDFSSVQFMSSSFLGVLAQIHRRVQAKRGHLTLKNVAPNIYKVFEITQLTKVFDIS